MNYISIICVLNTPIVLINYLSNVRTYVCMYVLKIYVAIGSKTCVCAFIYVCMYAYVWPKMGVFRPWERVSQCVYIHTYIHAYIYT